MTARRATASSDGTIGYLAAVSIGVGRSRNLQRVVGVTTLAAVSVLTAVLLVRVDGDGVVAVGFGGWPAQVGISLVADRFAVVGSAIEEAILSSDRFKPLESNITTGAFAEATLGRIGGFTVVGSNALDEDEAYCFHRTAYILATRAPAVPAGAKQGSAQAYGGLACTWTQDYDPDYLRDRSVVRAFAGAQATVNSADEVDRAVKLTLTVSS